MDLDRLPRWLKALTATLWVAFVLAPAAAWLTHVHGEAAGWTALAGLPAMFLMIYRRTSDDDLPDVEHYRRKASVRADA